MRRMSHHCTPITKAPALAQDAQTPLQLKFDAIATLLERLVLTQRSMAWGTKFPTDDTDTTA